MSRFGKTLRLLLVVAVIQLPLPYSGAMGAMIATETVIDVEKVAEEVDRPDRARVRALLQRDDVRAQIAAYGVDPDEALARADSLSDREIALIAERLDRLPAGAGALDTSSDELYDYALAQLIGFAIAAVLGMIIVGVMWLMGEFSGPPTAPSTEAQ